MHDRVKEVSNTIGKNIKQIRKQKNLTQLEIEVISGIDRGQISKIEAGLRNLELSTLIRIADALNIEISELFKS